MKWKEVEVLSRHPNDFPTPTTNAWKINDHYARPKIVNGVV